MSEEQLKQKVSLLLRTYGEDTLSYFSLQNQRKYFFDSQQQAYLSYQLQRNVAIVAGDPIGRETAFPELFQQFICTAKKNSIIPCFLGVTKKSLPMFETFGYTSIKIGEESLIYLDQFNPQKLKKKVRRAIRVNKQKNITIHVYPHTKVPKHIYTQIHTLSYEWLQQKGKIERGFSMNLGLHGFEGNDCEFICACKDQTVLAYLHMVPVYKARGWSLNAMRRSINAPNGLMEFLITSTLEMYREREYRLVSLNFATFANSNQDIKSKILKIFQPFLFHALSRTYQTDSLYQFNKKFHPEWQSRYIVIPSKRHAFRIVLAVMHSEGFI